MATQRDVMDRIEALTRQANQVSAAIAESNRANTASMEAIQALPENIRQRIADAGTQNLVAVSGALDTLAASLSAVGQQSGQGQAGAATLQEAVRTLQAAAAPQGGGRRTRKGRKARAKTGGYRYKGSPTRRLVTKGKKRKPSGKRR